MFVRVGLVLGYVVFGFAVCVNRTVLYVASFVCCGGFDGLFLSGMFKVCMVAAALGGVCLYDVGVWFRLVD